MKKLCNGKRLTCNSFVFIVMFLYIILFPRKATSELEMSAKAQPAMFGSIRNAGTHIQIGPYLKKNETLKLFFKVAWDGFYPFNFSDKNYNGSYNMIYLDAIVQKNKGEKFTIGPLVSLKMFNEFNIEYGRYRGGNWIGILPGAGIQYNINLAKGNVFSGRTCLSATVAKWCRFNKDEDSASWVDTAGFPDEYHYSESYLQNLKSVAKKYDRYIFPLYWTFSYTKYADWIFVGGGLNGFINFQYNKIAGFGYEYHYTTFFHFGVKIKRKAKVKNE